MKSVIIGDDVFHVRCWDPSPIVAYLKTEKLLPPNPSNEALDQPRMPDGREFPICLTEWSWVTDSVAFPYLPPRVPGAWRVYGCGQFVHEQKENSFGHIGFRPELVPLDLGILDGLHDFDTIDVCGVNFFGEPGFNDGYYQRVYGSSYDYEAASEKNKDFPCAPIEFTSVPVDPDRAIPFVKFGNSLFAKYNLCNDISPVELIALGFD